MAQASGAEGPEDEQGVGPFGGGGAQYTASLGLSTPEPLHIDDRGRVDLSGYRGKSNGMAHEWAQAVVDRKEADSRASAAASESALAKQAADALKRERDGKKGTLTADEQIELQSREIEQRALAKEKDAEAKHWERQAKDAQVRLKRADEEMSRNGDRDTVRAQGRQEVERIERRKARADARASAAADRAAQRLRRKGSTWRSNRRRQLYERGMGDDRLRERMLWGRLPKESMDRWSEAQKKINTLKGRLLEVEDQLNPRTSSAERERLERRKEALEAEIEGLRLDQYWEEHGGFPCAEIDCCDEKYLKCRPPCPEGAECICNKPPDCPDPNKPKPRKPGGPGKGDDDRKKGPTTQGGGPGKHADKEAKPPGIEVEAGGPAGGGGKLPPRERPAFEVPDGGGVVEDDAVAPDDGPAARAPWRPFGDAPPLIFPAGDKEYPVRKEDGEFYVTGDDGFEYRLKEAPPLKEVRGSTEVYDLAGIARHWLPLPPRGGRRASVLKRYWAAAKAIANEVTDFTAQILGAFAGLSYETVVTIFSVITGKSKPTMEELLGPLQDLIANTDFDNLSTFEKWAVGTLASFVDGLVAPVETFRQFGKGLLNSPQAFAQMMKDAANGDEKAQLGLLIFVATLRPGQAVASAKKLLGKVRSISASAAEGLGAVTLDDIVAALGGKGRAKSGGIEYVGEKVRVAIDERGKVTRIEVIDKSGAVRDVEPSGTAGGGAQRPAGASRAAERPTGKKRSAAGDRKPELVPAGAEHEAVGRPRGSGAGGGGGSAGAGERRTEGGPAAEPTKKPPATEAGGGGGSGRKPPTRTATGNGDGGGGDDGPDRQREGEDGDGGKRSAGPQPLRAPKSGDLLERRIETKAGPVDVVAEVEVQGNRLVLKDPAVYREGGAAIGESFAELHAATRSIAREAASWGFDTLEVRFTRVPGSSSVAKGAREIIIDLERYK